VLLPHPSVHKSEESILRGNTLYRHFLQINLCTSTDTPLARRSARMSCADNSSYISALGLGCAQHKRLVCTNLRSIGLSPNQVEEILVNCPASCNVSPCKEDDKRNGELRSIVQNISDGDAHSTSLGTKKATHLRAISKMSRNLNEFSACFPGWDPSCQDDSSYLSPIGLGCTGFQTMGCDVFSKVGFTAEEVKELKSRCPCSCQEACPSPTALPSSTPSTASPTPAPTISPSWHPTSSPTATPTRIPSPYPTRSKSFIWRPLVSYMFGPSLSMYYIVPSLVESS